jgi:hypothetical protein
VGEREGVGGPGKPPFWRTLKERERERERERELYGGRGRESMWERGREGRRERTCGRDAGRL